MIKPKHIEHPKNAKYLKDAVYGASDGIVSTFAVVAGVSGAALDPAIVLILGFANLVADGFSMAAGNYLGSKSEQNFHKTERKREEWEIKYVPEEEIEEIETIYKKKGFTGRLLHNVIRHITKNKKRWVDEMMINELGIIEENSKPKTSALVTFVAFSVAGIVPLISYVLAEFFNVANTFYWAIGLTFLALFSVGVIKSKLTGQNFFVDGMQMVLVGGIAAAVAYGVGHFIAQIV